MTKDLFHVKVLLNEVVFGIVSFTVAVSAIKFWRYISPEPEMYFWSLFFHVVEIVILMFVVRKVMNYVPGVFDVPFVKSDTLMSATVLLLVDWSKLNAVIK